MTSGAEHPNWRGGVSHNGVGYTTLRDPTHPNANSGKQVLEHVAIAARALGRPIPKGVQVHHVDEDPSNNDPSNLVVCQDQGYHRLLHRRRDALIACGNPNFMKCEICHTYDDPKNLQVSRTRAYRAIHGDCNARAQRERRRRLAQTTQTTEATQ